MSCTSCFFRIFTFCQYPFLLTLSAKRYLLQKDSESQMIEVARVRKPVRRLKYQWLFKSMNVEQFYKV